MNIHSAKLKAILLYFCNKTDPKFLGKVKLMKLFYFLDFVHVKKYGSPVTYDTYVHLEHGPIPTTIKNLIDEVCDDPDNSILADTVECQVPNNFVMSRILPKRQFTEKDERYFSKSELEVMNLISERFGDKNTKYIEDASHEEAPWLLTNPLEQIPYTLATKDRDCLVPEDEIKAVLQIYQQ